ncbi:MAG: transposase [Anaerolineae bacterium]|nr:transposase [Anaerolineae bacterium]
MKRLRAKKAIAEPKPTPTARGFLAQRFWEALRLDEALEGAGIVKAGGLAVGCILLVVLLLGVMNVTSLCALAEAVGQDLALCAVLGIQALEQKMLYRTLAAITVTQYRAWMSEVVRTLQQDPRTASLPSGVTAGDETQVSKKYGVKMPGIRVIFLHSEKIFTLGYDIVSTLYADWKKHYPLFCGIYQPDEAQQARIAEAKECKKLKVDRRKADDFVRWLRHRVEEGKQPQVVELSGNQLSPRMRGELDGMGVAWVGVSDQRRHYTLNGETEAVKAKALLARNVEQRWINLDDVGYRIAFLGTATCTLGQVMLVVVEHMDDAVCRLYVLPVQDKAEVTSLMSLVLSHTPDGVPSGKLRLMLDLLHLGRQAGIRSETATFDRWYFVPWFILEVLALGFKRVVIPAKAGFNYTYGGHIYDLPELWELWRPQDFEDVTCRRRPYRLLSRQVGMKDIGVVQMAFVEELGRKGEVVHRFVLMCTDLHFAPLDVLRVYKLRWYIEVCYRECKQNHGLGHFHARTWETIYGQILMSFLAYICLSLTRLLTTSLCDRTLGWIKRHYFNSLVHLSTSSSGETVIGLSPTLLDDYGLPAFCLQATGMNG